jgi:hypothetical protein
MNVERLLLLADRLDNFEGELPKLILPIQRFSIVSWICGSAACAGGFAALHPDFRALGLTAEYEPENGSLMPAFGGFFGDIAIQRFFGLSLEEANLFQPDAYRALARPPTPADVSARIRQVVAATRPAGLFCDLRALGVA